MATPPSDHRRLTVVGAVLSLAVTAALLWAQPSTPTSAPIPALSTPPSDVPSASQRPSPAPAAAGLGDAYFPSFGNSGYDVDHYDIAVDWNPEQRTLAGTTRFRATATEHLSGFHVDLLLPVSGAYVEGRPVTVEQTPGERSVALLGTGIEAGDDFTVEVSYAGRPADAIEDGVAAWLSLGEEQLIANEPQAAPWWFASNDHPSDPATFTISARVPARMQAISAGALVSRDAADETGHDTWVWQVRQPTPTYTLFLGIGDYEIREHTVLGMQQVDAVSTQHPPEARDRMFAELSRSGEAVTALEEFFGDYPLDALGGFVPGMNVWFGALETQARPVYHPRATAWRVIVHEYAHMWIGNHVTLKRWADIFNNEAFASYAEWLVDEQKTQGAAQAAFEDMFASFADEPAYWQVRPSDPGRDHLFSVAYTRGPMTLHALRVLIGDQAFFSMLRDWSAQQGPRSVADFRAFAQRYTDTDLTGFFAAWLDAPVVPETSPANGFR